VKRGFSTHSASSSSGIVQQPSLCPSVRASLAVMTLQGGRPLCVHAVDFGALVAAVESAAVDVTSGIAVGAELSSEAICNFELPIELPLSAKVEIVEAAASEAGGKLRSHEPKSAKSIASLSIETPSAASAAAVLLSALGLLQSVVGEAAEATASVARGKLSASVPPVSERSEVITSRRVEPSSSVSCVVSLLSIELRSHEPKSDRSIASLSVEAP
jgi:hypothetical protein